MAGSVNQVTLVGNLGKDPEIRSMNNGKRVASFSVATSDTWRDKNTGERKERTEWHNVVVFNDGLVGIIERYVHKGDKVYVQGALQTRKYTGKDGIERYMTEVVLQAFDGKLEMLGSPNGGGRRPAPGRPDEFTGEEYDDHVQSSTVARGLGGGNRLDTRDSDLDDAIPFSHCDPEREPYLNRRFSM